MQDGGYFAESRAPGNAEGDRSRTIRSACRRRHRQPTAYLSSAPRAHHVSDAPSYAAPLRHSTRRARTVLISPGPAAAPPGVPHAPADLMAFSVVWCFALTGLRAPGPPVSRSHTRTRRGIRGGLASSLRATGDDIWHLWPAITEHPAGPGAARHGHTRRKREHPGRIPPCRPRPGTRDEREQAPGPRPAPRHP
jgi:hypothetical protein